MFNGTKTKHCKQDVNMRLSFLSSGAFYLLKEDYLNREQDDLITMAVLNVLKISKSNVHDESVVKSQSFAEYNLLMKRCNQSIKRSINQSDNNLGSFGFLLSDLFYGL